MIQTKTRFTEEEVASARETDLPDLLEHLGYQVKRIGSYHTTREMDSLRIKNRRTWRRYSENVGGDAISFLQHFHHMDFREAVDAKPHTQTVTLSSNTNDMTQILQRLEGQIEAATEDGYTGVLLLDHTTVKVSADGYTTKTQTLSATRTYPNLSDADLSLIPKSIEEKGKTLTLADVQWASSGESGAERYTATASYGGTSSSRHATGYTVTADYTGQVARTDCAVVTYTAVFGSMKAPEESNAPEAQEPAVTERPDDGGTNDAGLDLAALKRPLLIGGVVVLLAAGGIFLFKKIKERK